MLINFQDHTQKNDFDISYSYKSKHRTNKYVQEIRILVPSHKY